MQKKCDLYLSEAATSDRLKFVSLFDKSFVFDPLKTYSGYLHVNVDRVKLVPVVSDLRKCGITCFSVPIEYRDRENLPMSDALRLANERARSLRASAFSSAGRGAKSPPVIWCFDLRYERASDEKADGVVLIDRIDGHVWTDSDYEEYMYDYNNIF